MEEIKHYDLYAIPSTGRVQLLKSFPQKSEAIMAFNLVVQDDKMKAVFLDERGPRTCENVRKWRKRYHAHKANR